MGFEVERRVQGVDCAAVPGRWSSGTAEGRAAAAVARRYAPLVFCDDLPPLPTPTAELGGADGPIEDGGVVELQARGFGRATDLLVAQCTGPSGQLAATTSDAAGAFVVDDLVLSAVAIGAGHCGDRPGACTLSWQRTGWPIGVDLPLDVVG
jgi:hypothetical protein